MRGRSFQTRPHCRVLSACPFAIACSGGFRTRVFSGQEEGQKRRGVRRVEMVPVDGIGLSGLILDVGRSALY